MRLSRLLMPTLKEVPSDAQIESHKLMLRAGIIRKVSSGLYTYLPLGTRILNKVEKIVRDEMDESGALEINVPILVSRELLETSGRFDVFGNLMMAFKDRNDKDYALGPTHEENFTELVRQEVQSYKDLPINLYQINTKFRDEVRPRFGVLRTREFIMKDAYSYHANNESLEEIYSLMRETYKNIFKRCGLDTVHVYADSGAMGGSGSEEFMVRSEIGEDTILECPSCGYVANEETAESYDPFTKKEEELLAPEIVETPDMKSIEEVSTFLKVAPEDCIKTLIYQKEDNNYVMVLIRGDLEVNEVKLSNALGGQELVLPENQDIENKLNLPVGFLGPVNIHNESITIVADHSVEKIVNGVTGANEKDKHLKNVNIEKDFSVSIITDLKLVKENDLCPKCNKKLISFKGVEVGHIFKLGKKYTEAFNVTFLDEHGNDKTPTMGCYGIGLNRIPAAIIEQSHDKFGIIWPITIAPYEVIVVPINWKDDQQRKTAEQIYSQLKEAKIDVAMDDRDLRPGVKFKDADLIGIPIRINIGDKALAENSVEIKLRSEKDFKLVKLNQVLSAIQEIITSEKEKLLK